MAEHDGDPMRLQLPNEEFDDKNKERLEDPKELKGYCPLHLAARSLRDNSLIVQLLIGLGADANCYTPDGYTALHFAVCRRKRDFVDNLIENGASVNSADFLGRTALHFSICKVCPDPPIPSPNNPCDIWIVERLLCHPEIDLNPVDKTGHTPLMMAIKEGNADAVKALLKAGANPSIPSKDNKTPLHVALSAENPSYDLVIPLLKNGAGIYCKDNFQQTPMDILVRHVRDAQTTAFASKCLWLIAFRYQIKESLKRKLEILPGLSKHLNECCKEVRLMNKIFVYGKFTLYDFAMGCFPERVEKQEQFCIAVVDILLTGLFQRYFELIFCHISLADLRSVLEFFAGNRFSVDTRFPGASNFALFDELKRLCDADLEWKRSLFRLKKALTSII